ncbi:MAG: 1,4-dihydroxy-2-naphthoate polyprenyltransferase [Opitutaceae bacterium]
MQDDRPKWPGWLAAARPRTLPVAVSPVIAGSALAWHEGRFNARAACLCLAFALLAQIAANFANDYFDYVKGADTEKRVGPRRAVASGLISPQAMLNATWGICMAAFVTGLGLLPFGGWPLLIVGIASLLSAVAYTGGPYPLGYHGLGDVFAFLFFGPVAVCSTVYVQTGSAGMASLLVSAAIGALAANVLLVNNARDAETDRLAGKRTLAVRFGRNFARWQFGLAHGCALLVPVLLFVLGFQMRLWACAAFAPLCLWALRQYRILSYAGSPAELIPLLGDCGLYLAAYAVALSLCIA